jgi:hypothetical protein
MTAGKEGGGLKSAYELAMARLDERHGKLAVLSDEQKREIAEAESRLKAGLAELEIMLSRRIDEARAAGDAEQLKQLEEQKATETRRLRERCESDKERIRRG